MSTWSERPSVARARPLPPRWPPQTPSRPHPRQEDGGGFSARLSLRLVGRRDRLDSKSCVGLIARLIGRPSSVWMGNAESASTTISPVFVTAFKLSKGHRRHRAAKRCWERTSGRAHELERTRQCGIAVGGDRLARLCVNSGWMASLAARNCTRPHGRDRARARLSCRRGRLKGVPAGESRARGFGQPPRPLSDYNVPGRRRRCVRDQEDERRRPARIRAGTCDRQPPEDDRERVRSSVADAAKNLKSPCWPRCTSVEPAGLDTYVRTQVFAVSLWPAIRGTSCPGRSSTRLSSLLSVLATRQ
jgi:hypothetical protein